jgi:O-antigen/teichoic acid export membrane protein
LYCTGCGQLNRDRATRCRSCGAPLAAPAHTGAPAARPTSSESVETGRGSTILALGILGILVSGLVLGLTAWVMGSRDMKKIRSGRIAEQEKGKTQAGMVLGMIATFFHPALTAAIVIFVTGLAR